MKLENNSSKMLSSRAKSTKDNGTFRVPKREEYSEYLRSHRVMNKNIFSMNKLIKSPLFKIV